MPAGVAVMAAFLGLLTVADTGPRQTAPDPVLPGAYTALAISVTTTNPVTGDLLQTDLYYPALADGRVDPRGAPHPAIVFAPAFIAQPAYYAHRGRHLASRGFLVAIPRFPNENLEARAADIQHVLTYLETQNRTPGALLEARVDAQRLGVAGHSLGGTGTLMVAARDPRVKVGVALDPIDPPALLNTIAPPLAAARGNPLRAAIAAMLRGQGLAVYTALMDARGNPVWDYAAEAPRIRIPLAVIGGRNGCNQFSDYANYSRMYPAIGAAHRALFVLPDGWHCDFLYTDSALVRNACFLTCGGSYNESRGQTVERYLTAWFEYYLAGRTEFYSYLFGAEAAADTAAARITGQTHTAPQDLAAAGGAGGVQLTWTAADYAVLAGYNIYRRQPPAAYPAAPYAQVGRNGRYADTRVTPAQTYAYVVRGRDAAGNEFQSSNEARAALP